MRMLEQITEAERPPSWFHSPISQLSSNGCPSVEAPNRSNDYNRNVPIAVIGFSLKFPQGAISPATFWQMLIEGRSARTEFPQKRFGGDALSPPGVRSRGQVG